MAKPTENQESSLQDFKFDDQEDWFGIKPEEGTQTDKVIKEVKGEKIVEEDGSTPTKASSIKDAKSGEVNEEEEEEEEVTFFQEEKPKKDKAKQKAESKGEEETEEQGEENEEEEEEEADKGKTKDKGKKEGEEENEEKEGEDEKFYTTLATELKEKGIFQNIELKEGETITEEKFFELQDVEVEKRVEETFEAFFEEMDDDGKDFLKFKKDGGKTQDFVNVYVDNVLDIEEFDEADETQREKVITHYLSTVEKLDNDEIKDRLQWLKEGGQDKTKATKYYNKIREIEKANKQALLKAQEEVATAREKSAKAFNESINEILVKTEAVGVFPISKVEQKELGSYLTKPSIKVGKNKYIPKFQSDIAKIFNAKTPEDKQKLIVLAKLVKSDFKVDDIVREAETKVVSKTKSKLREAKSGVKTASSGSYSKKSLGDFFSD